MPSGPRPPPPPVPPSPTSWVSAGAGPGGEGDALTPRPNAPPLFPAAASQRHALQSDPHGRGVARTLNLDLFLRRRRVWERLQAAPDRRRSLLGPLLED